MQEFNKISTESNFIKNLLISTYLPLIRTVRDFDYILADRVYIYKCKVVKCVKSGYIVTGEDKSYFKGDRADIRVLAEYYFGEKNDKLCTNYISNSQGYDSITHERLGKYLRSLRDMYGLNLMPLYNCFSNQNLAAHHIFSDRITKTVAEYNTKVYKVPIRFNTDYTICMENLGVTTFAPAFIKNENLMKVNNTRFGNGIDPTNKYIKLYRGDVIDSRANLRFKSPIKLRFDNIPATRHVKYDLEAQPRQLDVKHDPRYYKQVEVIDRSADHYYVRNIGVFTIELITEAEFNADKRSYFTLDVAGVYHQCNDDSVFSATETYYSRDLTDGKVTFEYTEHFAGLTVSDSLKVGSIDPTTRDVITVSGAPLDQIYQSIQPRYGTFNIINQYDPVDLYTYCKDDDSYVTTNRYYMWHEHNLIEIFNPLNQTPAPTHQIPEWVFNANKTHYATKSGSEYIPCTKQSVYNVNTEYYAKPADSATYVTAAHDYYLTNASKMILGYTGSLDAYFYINASGKMVSAQGSTYDIHQIYYVELKPKRHPWKEYSGTTLVESTDEYIKPNKNYYYGNLDLIDTYVYDVTEENCALYDYIEDNLCLLIQVPQSFNSNIVILEGDYTQCDSPKVFDESKIEQLSPALLDYLFTSNLKLMQTISTKPIPFSPTLIEFLLWNAIDNLDSINNNMDRLYTSINKLLGSPFTTHYANYWYPKYRQIVSDIGRNYNNIYVTDNLGYVTKDIEKIIETNTFDMGVDSIPVTGDE